MQTNESWMRDGFVLGLLAGAVGGAVLALMYAPASGRHTRDYLAARARDSRYRAVSAIEKSRDMIAEGREALERGRDALSTAIADGRDAYHQTKAAPDLL